MGEEDYQRVRSFRDEGRTGKGGNGRGGGAERKKDGTGPSFTVRVLPTFSDRRASTLTEESRPFLPPPFFCKQICTLLPLPERLFNWPERAREHG